MKQLLIAIDQVFNCLVWIPGDKAYADETLSARVWRCYLQGLIPAWPYRAIDALFFFDPNHCYESWRSEIERSQLPNHYRQAQ